MPLAFDGWLVFRADEANRVEFGVPDGVQMRGPLSDLANGPGMRLLRCSMGLEGISISLEVDGSVSIRTRLMRADTAASHLKIDR